MPSPLPPAPARPPQRLKRKIAAILAADVAGYSRLVAEDEERTLRDLAAAREVFDALVSDGGGRIFNTAGDSVMCEFDSAVEAVRVAVDLQAALALRNATVNRSRRLEFRIGITIGDVVERDGDLLGDGVNLAARLEGLAPVGGICVSRSVHEAVANKLPVVFRDLGEQTVKNIPQPVHVFAIAPPAPAAIPFMEVAPTGRPAPALRHEGGPDVLAIPIEPRRARVPVVKRASPFRSVLAVGGLAAFVVLGVSALKFGWPEPPVRVSPPAKVADAPPSTVPVEVAPAPPASALPASATSQPSAVPPARVPPAVPRPAVPAARAERPATSGDPVSAFAALARQGIVSDARTLPELYHNARAHEARGDRAAGQRSYAAAVPLAGDVIDPAWRYASSLRARGPDAARRTFADLSRDAASRGARAIAAWVAEEPRGALESFSAANPDYAPADYLLADAYLARAGGPTLTDRRLAFDALDRFLDASAQLPAFFMDRAVLDLWTEAARSRRAEVEAFFVSAARPGATFVRSEAGWLARLTLPEPARGVVVRLGERGEVLATSGPTDRGVTSAEVNLPSGIGRTTLYVSYRDASGQEAGPFPVAFDPGAALVASARETLERFPESWIQFRTDLPGVISYAQLVSNRCAIGRVLIGFGDEPPSQYVPLPGCDGGSGRSPAGAPSVLELPSGVDTVQVKLAYADGSESAVRTFARP